MTVNSADIDSFQWFLPEKVIKCSSKNDQITHIFQCIPPLFRVIILNELVRGNILYQMCLWYHVEIQGHWLTLTVFMAKYQVAYAVKQWKKYLFSELHMMFPTCYDPVLCRIMNFGVASLDQRILWAYKRDFFQKKTLTFFPLSGPTKNQMRCKYFLDDRNPDFNPFLL